MKKFFSSRLRWLLVIPAVLLVLYFVIYFVLYSAAFSRFAVSKAEQSLSGLEIRELKGSFVEGLYFDLSYSAAELNVDLKNAAIKVSPSCLLRISLCIKSIDIEVLQVDLVSNENEKDDSALVLPEISLPLRAVVERLSVTKLEIMQDGNELYSAEKINAGAEFEGSDVDLRYFSSKDQFCNWDITADVKLLQDYPLNAVIGCEGGDRFGQVSVILSGDLAQLEGKVNALISGDLVDAYIQDSAKVSLSFNLEPLHPDLMLSAKLNIDETITFINADNSVSVSEMLVNIDGPALAPTLHLKSTFENSLWPGRNDLNADVQLTGDSAQIDALQLLLPKGQVNALGKLNYSDTLHWQGEVAWQEVDINQWQAAATGIVSGRITNEVHLENEKLTIAINLDEFSGDLMGEALSGSGQLIWQNEELTAEQFLVQQGENKLVANGIFSPDRDSDLNIDITLPALDKFIPDAEGALSGFVRLSGRLNNIFVNGELEANQFIYSDLEIAQARASFNWFGTSQRDGDFEISVNGLQKAQQLYGNSLLKWRGNVDQHSMSLSFEGVEDFDQVAVLLSCSGGFNSNQSTAFEQWSGECGELNLNYALANEIHGWKLDSPLGIDFQVPSKAAQVSDFCFIYEEARLCSVTAIQFSAGDLHELSLQGSGFQIQWIQSFLDADMELSGDWGFSLSGKKLLTTPTAQAKILSDEIGFVWKREDLIPVNLDITEVGVDWSWQNSQHLLAWNFESKKSGTSNGQVTLAGENLSGNAKINALQLMNYSGFIFPNPRDKLDGRVDANINLSGNLEFPLINGDITLQKGEFVSSALPVPLSAIEMQLTVKNSNANVKGSFQALEGSGQIEGEFEWRQDASWRGELDLKAEDFTLKPDVNSIVRVSPDLVFKMSPEALVLSGEVVVPMARILIKALPEQALSTSADTVIVGQEKTPNERTISTELAVKLGDDVKFTGFGLETNLKGELRIKQENGGLLRGDGVVQLVEGRYKAYGQNLKINSGDLIFVSDIENPQIRLEAVRDNITNDIEVGLRASGAASKPNITLFSRPNMSDQEKFSYLLTGNPPGYEDGSEFDPTQAAAEAALSYALESNTGLSMTRRAAERLGIKDLKIATSSGDDGTQIGLSGYLTPDLMVRYGVGVFDAVNTLTLDYRLRKNLTLEAVSGESSALDLLWSFERD